MSKQNIQGLLYNIKKKRQAQASENNYIATYGASTTQPHRLIVCMLEYS